MSRACADAAELLQTSSTSMKTNCEIDFFVFIEFGREKKDCGLISTTLASAREEGFELTVRDEFLLDRNQYHPRPQVGTTPVQQKFPTFEASLPD